MCLPPEKLWTSYQLRVPCLFYFTERESFAALEMIFRTMKVRSQQHLLRDDFVGHGVDDVHQRCQSFGASTSLGPQVGWWKLVDPDGGSGKGPEVRLAESIEMCCSWKCRYTLCIYNIHMNDEQTVTVDNKQLLHDASWKYLMEVILILDPKFQRDIPSGGMGSWMRFNLRWRR